MDDYRHRKELFVSNLSGTTLYETGSIVINICALYFLCQVLKSSSELQKYSLINFLFEHSILITPMVLICTCLAPITHFFHFIIWPIAFLIYFLTPNVSLPNHQSNNRSYSRIIENFRGQILIVTCICILAVDFTIFPRRYAKTENYGYSGMDLGVGLFALAHGMVSSEARDKRTSLKDLFLENFVLIILGFIRLISIKYFSYVEHISEYGIHWNFFLTLCFMKLIGNSLLFITKNLVALIFLTLAFHEFILLQYFQYDNYLISSNNIRMNFIDANREGIFSLGGYVCLYLIGIYIGRLVMTNERDQRFEYMAIRFTISTIVLCGISFNPSRKLCNLSYISSTAGLASMCMAGFSLVQWLLLRKGLYIESVLLKNVNQKGLDTFLFANVLTGIINLNIKTIDASEFVALAIIFIYMFLVTAFAYFSPSLIKLTMKYLKLSK
jgi:phosphatidylinositol glycan class W